MKFFDKNNTVEENLYEITLYAQKMNLLAEVLSEYFELPKRNIRLRKATFDRNKLCTLLLAEQISDLKKKFDKITKEKQLSPTAEGKFMILLNEIDFGINKLFHYFGTTNHSIKLLRSEYGVHKFLMGKLITDLYRLFKTAERWRKTCEGDFCHDKR